MDAEGHLAALRSIADNLESDISASVIKLAEAKDEMLQADLQLSESIKAFDGRKKEIADVEESLNENLKTLQSEVSKLEGESSDLVTKKADLKIENFRLAEENARFKAYETKAWSVLKVKEESLIERESAIEQRENLKPNNKSLLPPRD